MSKLGSAPVTADPELFMQRALIWLFSPTSGKGFSPSALIFPSDKWKLIFFFGGLLLGKMYLYHFEAL